MALNEAFYGLPNDVKFCKKCVISNQRPSSTVEFKSTNTDKKEVIIEKKIDDLLSKERTDKIVGIASATLPIFLATYLAKKTYQSFTKKD